MKENRTVEIIEMAQALGLRIRSSNEGVRFEEAKAAYESNIEINNALMEYQIQQDLLSKQEDEDGEPMDEQTLTRVNDRINELYEFIVNHEAYKEYENAQKELNELITRVNSTIVAQITGRTGGQCSHDCSSCGGCH